MQDAGSAPSPPEPAPPAWSGAVDFHALAESLADLVFVADDAGVHLHGNARHRDFTGLGPGARWLDAVHPEDRARAAAWTRSAAAGEPFADALRLLPQDGEARWFLCRAAPVRQDGRVVRWVGTCTEIGATAPEQPVAPAGHAAYLLRLDEVLRSAPSARDALTAACATLGPELGAVLCAVAEVQPDGEHVAVESEWRAGDTASALGLHRLADYGPPRVADLLSGRVVLVEDVRTDPRTAGTVAEAAYAALGARASLDVPLLRDGEVRALLTVAAARPRRWPEAQIDLARTTAERVWDAAERARAEEALRSSEARYRALFTSIESGFCVVEVDLHAPGGRIDYRVVEANPAFYRQTGFPEAILGRWLRDAAPALEEHWYEVYGQVARSGEAARFEQGSEMLGRWFDVYAFRLGDAAEGRVAILFNDITARRRAELSLQELNATLEARVAERTASLQEAARALEAEMRRREEAQGRLVQAQKMEALGQVVGSVAHDFNNILAAMQGTYNLLERRIADEGLRAIIGEGRKAGNRAAALVQQMLAFARRQPSDPKVVEPARLLGGLEGMIRHAVGPRVACVFDVPDDAWPVFADPGQLEMAVLNLAVNARDAMPDGGTLTIRARNLPARATRPGEFGAGDRVAISVADTGVGMDEATLSRAFEPFFTTKAVGQGTGLGLAQVHGFAAASGGEARAESAPGRGTAVSLVLPRSALRPAEPSTSPAPSPEMHGGATILLVDDDDQVRPITAALLRDLGYAVAEASNAAVAKAMAQLHPVDLLLTDVVMPGTDGPSLARSMRDERPGLPVLFMTGYAGKHDLAGEAVVTKPFTGEDLGHRVAQALGRVRPDGRERGRAG